MIAPTLQTTIQRLLGEGTATAAATAYVSSLIAKASAGRVLHVSGYNARTSAQFIQIHDAATLPPDASAAAAEVFTVNLTSLTPAGLADRHFTFHDGTTARYAWFNLDAGGTDPAPEGLTGTSVPIVTGTTTTQMATALAAALDALSTIVSTSSGATATVTNASTGPRTNAADVNTGATILTTVSGVAAVAAGIPIAVITAAASSNFNFSLPALGLRCEYGVIICNSSTGPTKTIGSADCYFTALVR